MDYKSQVDLLKRQLKTSELIKNANEVVKGLNGFRLHPYMQVLKIETILKKHANITLDQKWADELFIREFYDLFDTLSFMHGFFGNSKYISPYKYYIESSLMLCYQGEYAGAINIIIPVIEAILVNFVTYSTGKDLRGADRYKEIKKMPFYAAQTMLNQDKESFLAEGYNPQQCNHLEQLSRKRLENWHFILEDFLQNGLFRYVTAVDVTQDMNRHAILHLFQPYHYHTLTNYIIMFNTLKMLSWIFAQIEGSSILIDIDSRLLMDKIIHYETLINKSSDLQVTKHILLREYDLHNSKDLKRIIRPKGMNSLPTPFTFKILLALKRRFDRWHSKLQLGRVLVPKSQQPDNKSSL